MFTGNRESKWLLLNYGRKRPWNFASYFFDVVILFKWRFCWQGYVSIHRMDVLHCQNRLLFQPAQV